MRRDLSTLESLGLIRRVHGGALPPESVTLLEARLSDRDLANTEEKTESPGRRCASCPRPSRRSSSTRAAPPSGWPSCCPGDHRLTVFTHAVPVAARLRRPAPRRAAPAARPRPRGAPWRRSGVETVEALRRIRADVAFVGTNGISAVHGLSTPDHEEAATKSALIAAAQQVVVLCDSSKIGVDRTMQFAKLSDIDVLVTDRQITDEQRAEIESADVEVVIA